MHLKLRENNTEALVISKTLKVPQHERTESMRRRMYFQRSKTTVDSIKSVFKVFRRKSSLGATEKRTAARFMCTQRMRASEVGKVSTPRGTPLQRVAGGWKHRGPTSCCNRAYKPGKKQPAWRLKGEGKRVLGARETRGARKEGGKRFFVCSAGSNSRASKVF